MSVYTVRTKTGEAGLEVEADSYQEAAEIACRQLNPGREVVAQRTTGDRDKSGWFQGYYHDEQLGCLNSTGPAFHVM